MALTITETTSTPLSPTKKPRSENKTPPETLKGNGHTSPQEGNVVHASVATQIRAILDHIDQIVLGKPHVVRLTLAALLARGHVLLDDVPGMGKTTLARAFAGTLGLTFQRVQFTSDLMPSDIVGVSIFNQTNNGFQFHPGPIFTQLLMADEINRASPRTQSALLEAMAERQVTIDGHTRPLEELFFVLATQNPVDLSGTFPLPDSQLDRFLIKLHLGYPEAEAEKQLIRQGGIDMRLETQSIVNASTVQVLQQKVSEVHLSEIMVNYLHDLAHATRHDAGVRIGLSPRGILAVRAMAQAWALLQGRDVVYPEDIQTVWGPVVAHRLSLHSKGETGTVTAQRLLQHVPLP